MGRTACPAFNTTPLGPHRLRGVGRVVLEDAGGRAMTRLGNQRSTAGGLDVHRHDRTHADQFAVARVDPIGVERFCTIAKPPEHFRRVVVREFDPVRVAVDELDSDCERHASEASRTPRRLLYRSARSGLVRVCRLGLQ